MANAISQEQFTAELGSQTDNVYLACLKITHSQIEPILLVNNNEELIRSDGTYIAFPFDITLPQQDQTRPPEVQIGVDITDQTIVHALRSIRGSRDRPKIRIDIVRADTPNTVQWGPAEFEFENFRTDGVTSGILTCYFMLGALNDSFPAGRITPASVGA